MAEETTKQITEESGVHKEWYNRARNMKTQEQLTVFMEELQSLGHDYGTICHALAASALAASWVMNASPHGGITGFQAGAVLWEFIRHWDGKEDHPMRLVDFETMLYPQSRDKYRTISRETWAWLQRQAESKLKDTPEAHPNVKRHWKSIAMDGIIPFGYSLESE